MNGGRQLVTGAAGLVGFELVRQLLADGAEVVAVDDYRKGGEAELEDLAGASGGRLRVVRGDLAQRATLESLEGPFETIYHLAAVVGVAYVRAHPWQTLRDNLASTLNLVELAHSGAARTLLFASSSENYASGVDAGTVPLPTPEDVPLSISDPREPRWSYAASKLAGESALFAASSEGEGGGQGEGAFRPRVVRLHNVYGPRMQPTHVVPEFLRRARERQDPFVVLGADQTRCFLEVGDAARALRLVADGPHEIVNVGADRETRIGDLARLVHELAGYAPELDLRPAPPGSVHRRVPDVSLLRGLGFEPQVSLEVGLEACWRATRER